MAEKQKGMEAFAPQRSQATNATKLEAMQKALDTLGSIAPKSRLQDYLKDNFGMKLPFEEIMTLRAEVLRQGESGSQKRAPSPSAAAQKSPPEVVPQPAKARAAAQETEGTMSKTEAIRKAVAALGGDADRGKIGSFVKEQFGIDISPERISVLKAEVVRKARGKEKPRTAKSAARKAETAQQTKASAGGETAPKPTHAPRNSKSAILVDDLLSVKSLVKRVGPEQLQELINVMSR